jgi:hypothetical protein
MKSSASPLAGVVLTLFMLVLVLLSLFWFLYQGWGGLQEQAAQADLRATRIAGLEGELRQNSEALLAAQGTRTALQAQLDEAIEAHQIAEAETIAEQREKDLLATRVATLTVALEGVQETLLALPDAPQVVIVLPEAGSILQINEPTSVVVVAADGSGLTGLTLASGGEVVTATLTGETLYTWRLTWTPRAIGEHVVEALAVNTAQVSSQPISVTVQVVTRAEETAVSPQRINSSLP